MRPSIIPTEFAHARTGAPVVIATSEDNYWGAFYLSPIKGRLTRTGIVGDRFTQPQNVITALKGLKGSTLRRIMS